MLKIKVVIVDDELEAREGVRFLLEKQAEFEVIGECKNGIEAIELIKQQQPDLVLLDIQMPGVNGFEVLNSLNRNNLPAVIFITAYDEYALKAFEVHALDYLLKPFTDDRFHNAVAHAKEYLKGKNVPSENQKLTKFLNQYDQKSSGEDNNYVIDVPEGNNKIFSGRLIIKADGKIHFVPLKEIIWVQAFDYYIKVHIAGKFYLVRESLKKMEASLPATTFLRIHKSSIVNMGYVKEFTPHFNNEFIVTLTNGEKLKTSRNYKDKLKKLFGI